MLQYSQIVCAENKISIKDRLIVEEHIRIKGGVDRPNDDGVTLLASAAFDGNLPLAKYLLKLGANPLKNGNGPTPIHMACYFERSVGVLKLLLDSIGDIETIPKGTTKAPLVIATERGNVEAINLLIARGADVNVLIPGGYTLLMVAMRSPNPYYSAIPLIEAGVDVNAKTKAGYTALHFASEIPSIAAPVKLLIDHGANVDVVSDSGETPLSIAREEGHIAIPRYLVAALNKNLEKEYYQRDFHDEQLSAYIEKAYYSGLLKDAITKAEILLDYRLEKYDDSHISIGRIMGMLSLIHADLGNYSTAKEYLESALPIMENYDGPEYVDEIDHKTLLGLMYFNMGELLLVIEKFDDAVRMLDKALFLIDRNQESGHFSVGVLNSRAKALRAINEYDLAEDMITRVFEKYVEMGYSNKIYGSMSESILTTRAEHVNILCSSGRCSRAVLEADTYLQEIRQYYLLWKSDLKPLTEFYMAAVKANFKKQNYSKVQILLDEIPYDSPQKLLFQGRLLAAKKEHKNAQDQYDKSILLTESRFGENHRIAAEAYYYKSASYFAIKDYKLALSSASKALKIIRLLRSQHGIAVNASSSSGLNILDYVQQYLVISNSMDYKDNTLILDEFRTTEEARFNPTTQAFNAMTARFSSGEGKLSSLVKRQQLLGARKRYIVNRLGELYGSKRENQRQLEINNLSKELGSIEIEMESTIKAIEKSFPKFNNFIKGVPIGTDRIQSTINSDEVILSYLVMNDYLHLCLLKTDKVKCKLINVSRDELQKMISEIRNGTDIKRLTFSNNAPTFPVGTAKKLYELFIEPYDRELKNIKTVYVVTGDQIQNLPFGLLIDSNYQFPSYSNESLRSAPWLIKRFAIARIPSASTLYHLRTNVSSSRAHNSLLGFGDPKLNNIRINMNNASTEAEQELNYLRTLPELPDTKRELEQIASLFSNRGTDIFTGSKATEQVLRSIKLADYKIISFATHALISGEVFEGSEPGLILTPERLDQNWDGILTASEIVKLNLDADWVILSACNTASIDSKPVSGLSGLSGAFLYSGARAILASHWPVETVSAADLTIRIFEALNSDSDLPKPVALQRAMLGVIEDKTRTHYSHPMYWAPFEIIGGARTLH